MRIDTNEIANQTLSFAASFMKNHQSEKGVGPTYGYFTKHPVAPLNRKRLKALLKAVESRSQNYDSKLRILDLACGGGIITCAMASLGHRVLGLDLSADEIRLARLFAQESKLNGIFQQCDLLKEGWEKSVEETLGGKPDVITFAYALHHLPQLDLFLTRLQAWVTPGTVLIINEENPDSPLFQLKHRIRTWLQKDTEAEWHHTYLQWKQMLEAHGFETGPILNGCDILPGLGNAYPEKAWSLVFTASRR